MKSARLLAGVLSAAALAAMSSDVGAGQSAAAFQPASPNDISSINHNGSYLWNADTGNFHTVVADLGVSTATFMSVHVRGFTQGQSNSDTQCELDARDLSSGASYEGIGSGDNTQGFPEGFYTLQISSLNLPGGPQYAFELLCNLGPLVPGHAGEQLWAWY